MVITTTCVITVESAELAERQSVVRLLLAAPDDPLRFVAAKSAICWAVTFFDAPASLTANSSAARTDAPAVSALILVSATSGRRERLGTDRERDRHRPVEDRPPGLRNPARRAIEVTHRRSM